jgi:predicted nucleic-acid-binding protein
MEHCKRDGSKRRFSNLVVEKLYEENLICSKRSQYFFCFTAALVLNISSQVLMYTLWFSKIMSSASKDLISSGKQDIEEKKGKCCALFHCINL